MSITFSDWSVGIDVDCEFWTGLKATETATGRIGRAALADQDAVLKEIWPTALCNNSEEYDIKRIHTLLIKDIQSTP